MNDFQYNLVADAIAKASKDWEDACPQCGIEFVHETEHDEAPSLDLVRFIVVHTTHDQVLTTAFFPSDAKNKRYIKIGSSFFETKLSRAGLMRHSLGHVLGYRHEHIGVGDCGAELGTYLTGSYDPKSVMHYLCGGGGTEKLALSEHDKTSHQLLYGQATMVVEIQGRAVLQTAAEVLQAVVKDYTRLPRKAFDVSKPEICRRYIEEIGLAGELTAELPTSDCYGFAQLANSAPALDSMPVLKFTPVSQYKSGSIGGRDELDAFVKRVKPLRKSFRDEKRGGVFFEIEWLAYVARLPVSELENKKLRSNLSTKLSESLDIRVKREESISSAVSAGTWIEKNYSAAHPVNGETLICSAKSEQLGHYALLLGTQDELKSKGISFGEFSVDNMKYPNLMCHQPQELTAFCEAKCQDTCYDADDACLDCPRCQQLHRPRVIIADTSLSPSALKPGNINITLTDSDTDAGDAVESFTLNNLPSNGTLYVNKLKAEANVPYAATNNELKLIFKRDNNFHGQVTFAYTAFYGNAISKQATFTKQACEWRDAIEEDHGTHLAGIILGRRKFVGLAAGVTTDPLLVQRRFPESDSGLANEIRELSKKSGVALLASQLCYDRELTGDYNLKSEQPCEFLDQYQLSRFDRDKLIERHVSAEAIRWAKKLLWVTAVGQPEGASSLTHSPQPTTFTEKSIALPQVLAPESNVLVVTACEKCSLDPIGERSVWPKAHRGKGKYRPHIAAPGGIQYLRKDVDRKVWVGGIPGVGVDGRLTRAFGTSQAAAFVGGVAAKMQACYPNHYTLSYQLKSALQFTSLPIVPLNGEEDLVATGLLDITSALRHPAFHHLKIKNSGWESVHIQENKKSKRLKWCKKELEFNADDGIERVKTEHIRRIVHVQNTPYDRWIIYSYPKKNNTFGGILRSSRIASVKGPNKKLFSFDGQGYELGDVDDILIFDEVGLTEVDPSEDCTNS